MATSIVTSKGQITVPIEIRQQMGLRVGDQLVFTKVPGTASYKLSRKERSVKSLIGMFKSERPAPTLEQIDEAIGQQIAIENDLDQS